MIFSIHIVKISSTGSELTKKTRRSRKIIGLSRKNRRPGTRRNKPTLPRKETQVQSRETSRWNNYWQAIIVCLCPSSLTISSISKMRVKKCSNFSWDVDRKCKRSISHSYVSIWMINVKEPKSCFRTENPRRSWAWTSTSWCETRSWKRSMRVGWRWDPSSWKCICRSTKMIWKKLKRRRKVCMIEVRKILISLNFHKLTVLKTCLWVGFIGTILELVLLCESSEVESRERRLFSTEVGVNYSISCSDLCFSSIWRDVTASTYVLWILDILMGLGLGGLLSKSRLGLTRLYLSLDSCVSFTFLLVILLMTTGFLFSF